MVEFGESVASSALSLARRFASGATMWCIAPEWPEHARHVAVEFVHPVLVGKRALPAVSVESADPVAALRSLVRTGDVVLAISTSESTTTREIMRRAEAWGATTIWMGVGAEPAERAADHIVWIEEEAHHPDSPAFHDGRLVLLYHVLWELTHVCFEHPGLLGARPEPFVDGEACADGDACITCSDEGRLGEVITADGANRAHVRTAKGIELIDTTVVASVAPGDLVLVHAGIAITDVP